MRRFVRDLYGPFLRLRVPFFPRFRPHRARAILRDIHSRLQSIPNIRLPFEILGCPQAFEVGVDLDFLLVALEYDGIALINHAHFRHLPAVTVAHHIGVNRVILRIGRAHEDRRALEKSVFDGFRQDFTPIFLTDLELKSRANPRQGWIGESSSVCSIGFRKRHPFEILVQWKIGQHTAANVSLQWAQRCLKRACRWRRFIAGNHMPICIERSFHRGLHSRRRRNVANPLKRFSVFELLDSKAIGIDRARMERGRVAWSQSDFRRNDLK